MDVRVVSEVAVTTKYSFVCGHCGNQVSGYGSLNVTSNRDMNDWSRQHAQCLERERLKCRDKMIAYISSVDQVIKRANNDHKRVNYPDRDTCKAVKSAMPKSFECPHCNAKQPWFPVAEEDETPNHTLKKSLLIGSAVGAACAIVFVLIYNTRSLVPMGNLQTLLSVVLSIICGASWVGRLCILKWRKENIRSQEASQKEIQGVIALEWSGDPNAVSQKSTSI